MSGAGAKEAVPEIVAQLTSNSDPHVRLAVE
jgi:hypothetical protein